MTPVKVWQERVEIPTYETGPQDNKIRVFLSTALREPEALGRVEWIYAERAENPEILAGGVAGKRLHQSDDPAGAGWSGASRVG